MNKFNKAQYNVQKEKRAKRSQAKRLKSGSVSLKVTRNVESKPPSGKKLRKLEKKLRRAQKEGRVTMEDIEMIAADNTAEPAQTSSVQTPSVKPASGFKVKKAKLKKKPGAKKNQPLESSGPQAMEE